MGRKSDELQFFKNNNPLLFPSILCEIFKFVKVKELKQCRLVCRDWELEAYRAMRGKVRISITNYMQVKSYINLEEARKDFCDSFIISSGINIETPLTSKLFADFGHRIKCLTLQKAKWKDLQLTALLFDRLPNLERLTIDCTVPKPNANGQFLYLEDGSGNRRMLPKLKFLSVNATAWDTVEISPSTVIKTLLSDFFTIAPMLEVVACPKPLTNYHPLEFLFPLDVAHIATFINGEVVDALDELSGLGFEANTRRILFDSLVAVDARTPKLTKLAEIDINMILRDEHVRKLTARNYSLRKLQMVVTQSVTLHNLHTMLRSTAGTLKDLSLRFLRRSTCSQSFPSSTYLSNLTNLTLTGYRGSLAFIQNFTNLESLVVVKIPALSVCFPPNDFEFDTPLLHLKTLEIYEEEATGHRDVRPNFIKAFPGMFPNLRRLRLDHLCDASLSSIYEVAPQLEELIAKNGKFTDFGLIGPSKGPAAGKSSAKKQQIQIHISPSILHLENLRVLDLHSKHLTDVGIISGVIFCKKLKRLTLMSYRITDVALRAIADWLDLEFLKTEFCYQLTTEVAEYVTDKMGGMEVSINEYEGPMNAMEMWKFLKKNNNMQIPITRMTTKSIQECKNSLQVREPQPSTSAAAKASTSSLSFRF